MGKILELADALKYQVLYGSYDWERVEEMLMKAAKTLISLSTKNKKLEAENAKLRFYLEYIRHQTHVVHIQDTASVALGETKC